MKTANIAYSPQDKINQIHHEIHRCLQTGSHKQAYEFCNDIPRNPYFKNVDMNLRVQLMFKCAIYGLWLSLQIILLSGVSILHVDMLGRNVMHYAAFSGKPETVAGLLAGMYINNDIPEAEVHPLSMSPPNGRRTMMDVFYAARDIRKKLVNAKDIYGATPLHYAASKCNYIYDMQPFLVPLQFIIASMFVDEAPYEQCAQSFGQYNQVIEKLLPFVEDKNTYDHVQHTALHHCAYWGYKDTAIYLINDGADINAVNSYSISPIYYAAFNGHVELVNVLCSTGADVNLAEQQHGFSPLHAAAKNGQASTVRALLNCQARTDITDRNGETVVHLAAREGFPDVLLHLVLNKVDLNKRNHKGLTPLAVAAIGYKNNPHLQERYEKTIDYLTSFGGGY